MPPDDSCSLKPSRHLLLFNQQHVFPSRARRLRSSLQWNTRICASFAPGSPVAIISTNCCTNTTSSFIPEAWLTPSHRASISLFSQCSCSRSRSGWYRLLKLNQLTCRFPASSHAAVWNTQDLVFVCPHLSWGAFDMHGHHQLASSWLFHAHGFTKIKQWCSMNKRHWKTSLQTFVR